MDGLAVFFVVIFIIIIFAILLWLLFIYINRRRPPVVPILPPQPGPPVVPILPPQPQPPIVPILPPQPQPPIVPILPPQPQPPIVPILPPQPPIVPPEIFVALYQQMRNDLQDVRNSNSLLIQSNDLLRSSQCNIGGISLYEYSQRFNLLQHQQNFSAAISQVIIEANKSVNVIYQNQTSNLYEATLNISTSSTNYINLINAYLQIFSTVARNRNILCNTNIISQIRVLLANLRNSIERLTNTVSNMVQGSSRFII